MFENRPTLTAYEKSWQYFGCCRQGIPSAVIKNETCESFLMRFAYSMYPATALIWGMDAAWGVASMLISGIDGWPQGLLVQGTKIVRYSL